MYPRSAPPHAASVHRLRGAHCGHESLPEQRARVHDLLDGAVTVAEGLVDELPREEQVRDASWKVGPEAVVDDVADDRPINGLSATEFSLRVDDAAIVSGASIGALNSGGPLLTLDGQVVAMNSLRATTAGAGGRVATSIPGSSTRIAETP